MATKWRLLRPYVVATLFLLAAAAIPAKAEVITFNSLALRQGSYEEAGMMIRSISPDTTRNFLLRGDWLGVQGLEIDDFGYFPIEFTYAGGGAFTPLSFFNHIAYWGATFTGYIGERQVAQMDYADYEYIRPGDLYAPRGETITFSVAFQNITRLVWSFSRFYSSRTAVIDNLRFEPTEVPEPTTMLLLGTGLAVLGVAASKRRQAKAGDHQ